MVVRRAETLVVAYDIVNPYVKVTAQILRQAQGSSHLPVVIEDV